MAATVSPSRQAEGVVRLTIADQVAELILQRIGRGLLRPGDPLPSQRALAKELGVSLSTVREAVQRLQMLRVVRTQHGRGMVVDSLRWPHLLFDPSLRIIALEESMLRHLLEARHAIEIETARLAAERASEGEVSSIRSILETAEPFVEDFEENQRLNRQFHLAIAHAAGNPVLRDLLQPLLEIDLSAVRQIFDKEISRKSWRVHREIFEAIAREDAAGAVAAMELHARALEAELERVEGLVRSQRQHRVGMPA